MSRISDKKQVQMEEMRKHRPVDWRNTKGAPTKEGIVRKYRNLHPEATKYRCHKDTGLSMNTVNKWWDSDADMKKENIILYHDSL